MNDEPIPPSGEEALSPHYEMLHLIGSGAYGEVYLARDSSGAYRAVKVIFRESFDSDRPFEREYEGLQKFKAVSNSYGDQVQVFHIGRREEPMQFFYVMELADDQVTGRDIQPETYVPKTLRSELKTKGRLGAQECARVGATLASALQNLHENGLIHRDIKPANIIFIHGQPKLADIGLVTDSADSVSHVGTEGFIPPEGPGSPQADIYSLGKVLYEACTGLDRMDFPELPSNLHDFPDLDTFRELNAVIARACERDPRRRYPNAQAMRNELICVQRGISIRSRRSLQNKASFVGKVIGVAALLGIVAAGILYFRHVRPVSRKAPDSGQARVGWEIVPAIRSEIRPPSIPTREYSITDFGNVGNGSTDVSQLIQAAIEACVRAGGGRVVVPPGTFITGPIHLRTGVELHLQKGAVLKFNIDPDVYLPPVLTRFEGMDCFNYSPMIYAFAQHDIAVSGEGLLDAQAGNDNWWSWNEHSPGSARARSSPQSPARDRLIKMVEQHTPVSERRFGDGDYLRPALIQFYQCTNVSVEGISARNTPMTAINPVLCENVILRAVKVTSHGPQNDGCQCDSSHKVLIEDCVFDNADDCIAIKSGRNDDGRRIGVAAENILIQRCAMKNGHGGVTIGSEISGGCRNVFIDDCIMDSPTLDRALRFKSNAVRGGTMENVFMRNTRIERVTDAILQIDFLYEEGANGSYPPVVRNVSLENIAVSQSPRVLNIVGFPGAEISGIRVANSTFKQIARSDTVKHARDVTMVGCTIEGRR